MKQIDYLEQKINNSPRLPGVYLMKDKEGKIIYVGKAKDLRSRIRAYFSGTDSRSMVPFLVSRIHDLDYIVTETEKEALILENNLIKEHRPKYNIYFRDDKTYFHIRIDLRESFPHFQLVRRPPKDGAKYFGPYPSSSSAKETLRFLQPIFPLRTCRDQELKSRKRPCLEYEIGRCPAPCVCFIDMPAYHNLVRDAVAFLDGKEKGLIDDLQSRMNSAAEETRFEDAAVLRDRIAALEETLEKQSMVSMNRKDQDIYGVFREGNLTLICAVFVREGKILGQKAFPLFKVESETSEILSSLIKQYYDGEVYIPQQIVIPDDLEDQSVIAEWLTEKKGKIVSVIAPQRGKGSNLLDMARHNAENLFYTEGFRRDNTEETIKTLAKYLSLKNLPMRIECFDISNISGRYATGSMVTFVAGNPWKAGYRRYKIKTVEGADDYSMMYEVLKRRYIKRENFPDLIMVDGGKGHLGVAVSVLKDLDIGGIDVIAIAKGNRNRGKDRYRREILKTSKDQERVYIPAKKEPLYLSRWPAILFLLQRIRDEAHRFAISYHRKIKRKQDFQSLLDNISGLGKIRKKELLTSFGNVKNMRNATKEDLQKVAGVGKALAKKIYDFLQDNH